jgi:hypothetical protein
MRLHHLRSAIVQSVTVLVQHHRVRVSVQLFKTQARVVLLLDFGDGISEHFP